MRRVLIWSVWTIFLASMASAGEIGYIEDFSLAKDRAASLRQLIPGTEDHYYYHCLNYLNTEQFDKAAALTRPWLERYGQTPRLTEIQTRYALLTYERRPQQSLAYLRNHLGLLFNQQRIIAGASPNVPTSLDPQVISRDTLRSLSLTRWQNLDNFEDAALDWLATENLDWQRQRYLLQRLTRPDVPHLPEIISQDLQAPSAQPFGSFSVERQLTQAQLKGLLGLRPELLNQTNFVHVWISKLHPGADDDWRHESALTRSYLERLQEFVTRLSPAHNALKAHILYHRLVFDRAHGVYDRGRFLAYLQLPRRQPYMAKALLERDDSSRYPADLNADFTGLTMLAPVGTDEALVRAFLKHLLVGADSPKEFEPYINDVYLRHLFAEVKIENGLGDAEQWAARLPPEIFRQLKERIDIDFANTNKSDFTAEEPVELDLFVKNVPSLFVKVFEINTFNFYRTHQREADTDINLDGLVANAEETHDYSEPPLRRVSRRFAFPQLKRPGVYVIDFIGAGKSSRALIRKGKLRPITSTGPLGQVITVFDDANRPVKDASVWFGGADYSPDEKGRVVLPFSTSPARQPIVIHRGDFACLDFMQHQAENYQLHAGIHVDRESLLTQRIASLVVRPGLYLNGIPVPVGLLTDVKLRITATNHAGIATSTEVPNFKLFADRESVHDFRVPPRLASLDISLQAKVKSLTQSKSLDLSAGENFVLNQVDQTEKTEDLHLARFGPEYVIELLGRTGEVRADRAVQLSFKHRDFRQQVPVTLKSDARGRIHLGTLAGIEMVTATGPEGVSHTWRLPFDQHTYRQLIDIRAGEVVTLPYLGSAVKPEREELALFQVVGDVIQADRFDSLALTNGMMELRGLAAGDYDLWLKRTGQRIRIRVVAGAVQGDYVLGKLRYLELPALKPIQIASIVADADQVAVQLRDVSPFTRVHIFATRYVPAYSAFAVLAKVRDAELGGIYPAHAESVYLTGRKIGDEYRYVLDRRTQKKYPGNMLERPGLLLNPWAIRSTEMGEQIAQGGEEFGASGLPAASEAAPGRGVGGGGGEGPGAGGNADFADLDFLADTSSVLVNCVPDKDGMVKVSRKAVGSHAMLHVVAVDPLHTTYRSTTLAEQPAPFVDLRLHNGLDPRGHFAQQKQVSILTPQQPFVIADAAESRFEAYDSLARVYGLYMTLSKDAKLAEFSFLLKWPKLKLEEKRALYSKYACHELHFFLLKKDPAFFQAVVKPYLANKKDKTFLDRWLLEEDVHEFLQPWSYARLNTVERDLLAQRIQGEREKTSRYLNDLSRLQPPSVDHFLTLFETGIQGTALEREGRELGRPVPKMLEEPKGAKKPAGEPLMPPASPMQDKAADKSAGFGLAGKDGTAKKEAKAREETLELFSRSAISADDARSRLAGGLPVRQLYRRLGPTMEWAENNYYHLPIQQQVAELVPVNAFWLDYSRYDGKGPFLSKNVAEASRNFTEMVMALAVLDLPFESPKHEIAFKDGKMTFTPVGPVIAFHEEVRSVQGPGGQTPILISQNFYRQGDRYREENGEKIDKFITGEFVAGTVYGCQVVVTNPTSSRQRLAVLLQVPVGSIPVGKGQFTRSLPLDLEPYRTQAIDYYFYFPLPGKFVQFPVHVAKNEQLIAAAQPATFDVLAKPSKLDTSSWEYVSQNGTNEEALAMLGRENVFALDLNKIAFRMKDRTFFGAVVQLLRQRHAYSDTLWSFALYHNDPEAAQQYLLHSDRIVAEVGGPIRSPLLTVDPVAWHNYEHLEYKPLVNARAHALGQRRHIVNARLNEQYHRFLKLLSYHPQLTDEDKLDVTYYFLLQDRSEEALSMFGEVRPDVLATRLQYDYCRAYLDCYRAEPEQARALAARYADYPVDRWRNYFLDLLHQLNEAEGHGAKVADAENQTQRQGQLAATEPGFEFTIDSRQIQLTWQHLESVRVHYYLMDVELLFSRNPFVQEVRGPFASIRPNSSASVKLPAGQSKLTIPLPKDLVSRNVLVEITGAGKTWSRPYYANAMEVRLLENYGQVRVAESAAGKPLPKVYVKVYARLADGTVKFHKDGYTDLRGRFDYATVSTVEHQPINKFAVLVLSDERGAQIKEAAPPQQ